MRRLIVTGDDFGFSYGVNEAIVRAHQEGILTSASLMIAEKASAQAVSYARAHPDLAVGLHLVVAAGRPALPPAAIPRLVDRTGRIPDAPVRRGVLYQFSSAARAELRREIREQLDRFRRTGLRLSHVDGHLHMHMHPVVLRILADFAEEFAIPAVRMPREELRFELARDRRGVLRKVAWSGIFALLRRHGVRVLRRSGIDVAERVYGLLSTGRVSEEGLVRLIGRITVDRAEIYCHPAIEIPGEARNGPAGSGARELAALLSPAVREAVARAGFTLSWYSGDGAVDRSRAEKAFAR